MVIKINEIIMLTEDKKLEIDRLFPYTIILIVETVPTGARVTSTSEKRTISGNGRIK